MVSGGNDAWLSFQNKTLLEAKNVGEGLTEEKHVTTLGPRVLGFDTILT